MSKKERKEYNDRLMCYAILIFTIGLVLGSGFISLGIRADSLNAIGYCIVGAVILLTFLCLSFVMYIEIKKDEIKMLEKETN